MNPLGASVCQFMLTEIHGNLTKENVINKIMPQKKISAEKLRREAIHKCNELVVPYLVVKMGLNSDLNFSNGYGGIFTVHIISLQKRQVEF